VGFLRRSSRSNVRVEELLEQQLLVPTPDTGEPPRGSRRLEEDRDFDLVLVADDEGRPVLPAFTSEEALARWIPEGSRYVALPGRLLLELMVEHGWDRLVVDGADAHGVAITRAAAARSLGR
jgi:SseB protein N-terminal domain